MERNFDSSPLHFDFYQFHCLVTFYIVNFLLSILMRRTKGRKIDTRSMFIEHRLWDRKFSNHILWTGNGTYVMNASIGTVHAYSLRILGWTHNYRCLHRILVFLSTNISKIWSKKCWKCVPITFQCKWTRDSCLHFDLLASFRSITNFELISTWNPDRVHFLCFIHVTWEFATQISTWNNIIVQQKLIVLRGILFCNRH